MDFEISKYRKIAGWAIAIGLTAMFLHSAYGKFTSPEMMERSNLGDWGIIIAIGEIISILLYLFPRTNIFGTVLLSSYMGGAIILHMTGAISIFIPSAVLIVVWIGSIIRNPELYIKFISTCPVLRLIKR